MSSIIRPNKAGRKKSDDATLPTSWELLKRLDSRILNEADERFIWQAIRISAQALLHPEDFARALEDRDLIVARAHEWQRVAILRLQRHFQALKELLDM